MTTHSKRHVLTDHSATADATPILSTSIAHTAVLFVRAAGHNFDDVEALRIVSLLRVAIAALLDVQAGCPPTHVAPSGAPPTGEFVGGRSWAEKSSATLLRKRQRMRATERRVRGKEALGDIHLPPEQVALIEQLRIRRTTLRATPMPWSRVATDPEIISLCERLNTFKKNLAATESSDRPLDPTSSQPPAVSLDGSTDSSSAPAATTTAASDSMDESVTSTASGENRTSHTETHAAADTCSDSQPDSTRSLDNNFASDSMDESVKATASGGNRTSYTETYAAADTRSDSQPDSTRSLDQKIGAATDKTSQASTSLGAESAASGSNDLPYEQARTLQLAIFPFAVGDIVLRNDTRFRVTARRYCANEGMVRLADIHEFSDDDDEYLGLWRSLYL